jgi:hypothetical protein
MMSAQPRTQLTFSGPLKESRLLTKLEYGPVACFFCNETGSGVTLKLYGLPNLTHLNDWFEVGFTHKPNKLHRNGFTVVGAPRQSKCGGPYQ